jgi:ubiquinone/menaquinone biosynthesis C-methylase UbiE
MSHHEEIRREFAKQAPTFEDPGYTFADRRLLAWIQDNVPAEAGVSVLDVAGGTGHMARAYAVGATVAVVLDLTAEMLALGQCQAQAEELRNVVFVHGDAAHMPFVDDAFDLVLSRFAIHHFERPEEQVSEMVSVCRPDGRIAIIDLVAPDPALAGEQDRLERLRDRSHTRALSVEGLRTLLERSGARAFHETFHDHRLPVERWLAQTAPPAERAQAIRAELSAELDGGTPTGMRPIAEDGELHLTHRYAIVVARKGAPDGRGL